MQVENSCMLLFSLKQMGRDRHPQRISVKMEEFEQLYKKTLANWEKYQFNSDFKNKNFGLLRIFGESF